MDRLTWGPGNKTEKMAWEYAHSLKAQTKMLKKQAFGTTDAKMANSNTHMQIKKLKSGPMIWTESSLEVSITF